MVMLFSVQNGTNGVNTEAEYYMGVHFIIDTVEHSM